MSAVLKEDQMAMQDRISLTNGAFAQSVDDGTTEKLQVFSENRTLLFEYDANQGKTRVHIESGGLEFVVPRGDISFATAGHIRFRGQSIEMQSRSDVRLKVVNALGGMLSGLTIWPRKTEVQSPELQVASQQGRFHVEEMAYSGQSVQGQVSHLKLTARKIETVAQSIVAKAKNVYETVEELSQLRAGRLRQMIDSTYHLKAGNTYLNSDEDCKIKAEKIHLG